MLASLSQRARTSLSFSGVIAMPVSQLMDSMISDASVWSIGFSIVCFLFKHILIGGEEKLIGSLEFQEAGMLNEAVRI